MTGNPENPVPHPHGLVDRLRFWSHDDDDERSEAADRIEALEAALADLVDDEPCRLDHHGGCQAHGFLEPPCGVATALVLLDAAGFHAPEPPVGEGQ